MYNQVFFEAFGKVLHSLAMVDGNVQESERNELTARIKATLAPIPNAEELGHFALTDILKGEAAAAPSVAIQQFLVFLRNEPYTIEPAHARALTAALEIVAASAGIVEPQEQQFIDLFDSKVSALAEL